MLTKWLDKLKKKNSWAASVGRARMNDFGDVTGTMNEATSAQKSRRWLPETLPFLPLTFSLAPGDARIANGSGGGHKFSMSNEEFFAPVTARMNSVFQFVNNIFPVVSLLIFRFPFTGRLKNTRWLRNTSTKTD